MRVHSGNQLGRFLGAKTPAGGERNPLYTDIHPLIIPEILRWFYDPKINKYNAQLIISCHNATLLETLIKEEVYFTEKNNKGETEIYGLKDITDVRRDTNIYKKYLGGAFGAVPHIG